MACLPIPSRIRHTDCRSSAGADLAWPFALVIQVGTHADVAHAMGLLDDRQRAEVGAMQAQVQQLIADGEQMQLARRCRCR